VLVGGHPGVLGRLPKLSGRFEGAPDVVIVGAAVERNKLETVRALLLKAVADPLRSFSKHHRALAALYLDLVVDHVCAQVGVRRLVQRVADAGEFARAR